jgi:hypothetical protein
MERVELLTILKLFPNKIDISLLSVNLLKKLNILD